MRFWLPWVIVGGAAVDIFTATLSVVLFSGLVTPAGLPVMPVSTESREFAGDGASFTYPAMWVHDPGSTGSTGSTGASGLRLLDRQVFVHTDGNLGGVMAVIETMRLVSGGGYRDAVESMIADQLRFPIRNSVIPVGMWNPGCLGDPNFVMEPRQSYVENNQVRLDVAYSCRTKTGAARAVTRILIGVNGLVHALTVVADNSYVKRHADSLKPIVPSFRLSG